MSVFVKICGVTSEEDALLSVAMGANAIGFNFVPSSPRLVRPALVSDIIKRLDPSVVTIGVFRDETPERVGEIVNTTGLTGAQLHGTESPATVKATADRVRLVIKAFAAGSPRVRDANTFGADIVMIDAPSPGSGKVFDWSLAGEVPAGVRLMLAGGLDQHNVAAAIEAVQPWAVDCCSGTESSPGHKDPVKLRAFVAAAKAVRQPEAPVFKGERPFDWELDS